jgi:hypothetical protein
VLDRNPGVAQPLRLARLFYDTRAKTADKLE